MPDSMPEPQPTRRQPDEQKSPGETPPPGRLWAALAPIRSSSVAIHVNNKPVSPPYVILALGDTADLQSRFADSTHGLEWLSLQETYGFKFDVNNEDSLDLPGARMPVLRSVRLAGSESTPESQEVAP